MHRVHHEKRWAGWNISWNQDCQDTGCLGLVHWDDPERWYGEGGGNGVQDGELMYTCGRSPKGYLLANSSIPFFSLFFFNFYFYFILLYNTVLVLPYIDMNPPQVYMSSQSWTPLPPPTPYHLSGSSLCTSPYHPESCIEHRVVIHFLRDSIHVSMPFSQIIPPTLSLSHRV